MSDSIMRLRSCRGPVVLPTPAPGAEHQLGIARLAEAAVVAAESAPVVAFLDVEVMAQDYATITQVGAQVEKVVGGVADQLHPERHHLQVAAGACPRYRVLAEAALDLQHAEHELRVEPGARRLVVHRAQEPQALLAVGNAPR